MLSNVAYSNKQSRTIKITYKTLTVLVAKTIKKQLNKLDDFETLFCTIDGKMVTKKEMERTSRIIKWVTRNNEKVIIQTQSRNAR